MSITEQSDVTQLEHRVTLTSGSFVRPWRRSDRRPRTSALLWAILWLLAASHGRADDPAPGATNSTHNHLSPRATVILADFPSDPERLLPDVREIAPLIVARHGFEEWKAAVLTSELHRHLGTYSIVGVKMGLAAREHFGVALDELRVESHAGLKPPLSCVNDGLQVGTGASLGRGTITVLTNMPACEALFAFGNRQLRLRLKPEFAKRIAADMAALEKKHGGTTPAYFEEVRAVSLKHWLDFSRNTMFDELEEILPAKP